MRRCFLLTIAVPALCCSHAQPDLSPLQRPSRPMMEAAQQHFRSGTRFYEEGSWDAALVEFEASWRLSGEADLLHNISWTHEKAGRTREALEYAERYLSACRGTEDEERAAKRVAFLRQRFGGGAAATTEATVTTAQTVQNAASRATAAPSSAGRAKPPGLAIGLLAGGGALALAGVGCLAGAWWTGQQVSNPELTFVDYGALGERGRALNATGLALTITGGALVIGGAVTWAVRARSRARAAQTTEPTSPKLALGQAGR